METNARKRRKRDVGENGPARRGRTQERAGEGTPGVSRRRIKASG
jgi:hypothetical protein